MHEIVGVRMFDRTVLRELNDVVRRGERVCEPPPSRDTGGASGAAGQCWITITSGGQTLWRFLAIRPAASSGTNGSGIELRYVDYKGKRVLYQAHVPILNVEYGNDGQEIGCGPTYRDWQDAETQFEANGTAVAPGFLLCPQPARTIVDSGSDQGNFAGVAIYVDGPEVVLVSEVAGCTATSRMAVPSKAGSATFLFGARRPLQCHLHTHHSIGGSISTCEPGTQHRRGVQRHPVATDWHTKQFEIRRQRDPHSKAVARSDKSSGETTDRPRTERRTPRYDG